MWIHCEPSVAVIGLDRAAALALGRCYGQEASFELTPPSRAVLSCQDGRKLVAGWRVEQLPGEHPETDRAYAGRLSSRSVPGHRSMTGSGEPGREASAAACGRCGRGYGPDVADAGDWNMVLRDGQIIGLVCPRCQRAEEDLEAQINQMLVHDAQAQLVERAELVQIRAREGSVKHVGGLPGGQCRNFHPRKTHPYPRTATPTATPSTVKSPLKGQSSWCATLGSAEGPYRFRAFAVP